MRNGNEKEEHGTQMNADHHRCSPPAPCGRSRHRVLRENRIAQNSHGGSVGKRTSELAPCHPKPHVPSTPSRFCPCTYAGDFERKKKKHGTTETQYLSQTRRTPRTKTTLGHRFTLLNKIRCADLSFRHLVAVEYFSIKPAIRSLGDSHGHLKLFNRVNADLLD